MRVKYLIPLDAISESAMLGESICDGGLVSPSRYVKCDAVKVMAHSAAVNYSQLQQIAQFRYTHGMPIASLFSYRQRLILRYIAQLPLPDWLHQPRSHNFSDEPRLCGP